MINCHKKILLSYSTYLRIWTFLANAFRAIDNSVGGALPSSFSSAWEDDNTGSLDVERTIQHSVCYSYRLIQYFYHSILWFTICKIMLFLIYLQICEIVLKNFVFRTFNPFPLSVTFLAYLQSNISLQFAEWEICFCEKFINLVVVNVVCWSWCNCF